jgi:hypothetical protein
MTDDTPLPFDLPSVQRKKLTVDFAAVDIKLADFRYAEYSSRSASSQPSILT